MTDPAYDAFRTRLESGGDDNAYNPRSGALGKHQFLASTWLGLVHRYQPAWAKGLTEAQILDKRRDGAVSDQMVALFDRENVQALTRAGYTATPGNLYLAHHFGAEGAVKILGAADSTPMQSLVSAKAYRANPHLQGKTKAQVLADFVKRGGSASASAAAPIRTPVAAPAPTSPPAAAYTPFTLPLATPAVPPQASPPAPAWTFTPTPPAPSPAMRTPVYTSPGMAAQATPLPEALPFQASSAGDAPDTPTPLDQLLRLLR